MVQTLLLMFLFHQKLIYTTYFLYYHVYSDNCLHKCLEKVFLLHLSKVR